MSKFRDGMLGPTIILFAICALITVALAATYNVTEPVIAAGEIEKADAARVLVLPDADGFTQIETQLPEGVSEAYKADNGAGFVFKSEAKGFGGAVVYMIGMDADGNTVGIQMFSHAETPGLGTKIFDEAYMAGYLGDVDPSSVDAVSGATRTTNSLKNSLLQAKEAYEIVKGA